MAIFHCSIDIVTRTENRSSVAAAAYRSGEKITNCYDGITHDYTSKGGIVATDILLPEYAPEDYKDRSTLWNSVEKVERSCNAQLARDIEVSIPVELPPDQWKPLIEEYCQANFVSHGMIADYAIHDKQDGNPHCHILLTMRPIKEDGTWGAKCKKEYILDDAGCRIKLPSGTWKSRKVDTTDWNDKGNAEIWRESWSKCCNKRLEPLEIVIDHRSYKRQGIEQIPTVHMGVAACQMEARGIATERGDYNRQAIADNRDLRATRARITRLMKWQREEQARPLDLAEANVKPSVAARLYQSHNLQNHATQLRDLKSYSEAWVFLQDHDIKNPEDFFATIQDMNDGFYALKGELKTLQTVMETLDNQCAMWEEYQALKPTVMHHRALPKRKQKAFYEAHAKKLDRYEELQQIWTEYKADGGKINPRHWKRDKRDAQRIAGLYQWKMKAFQSELSRAERLKKALEPMLEKEVPTKHKAKERG